MIPRNPFFIGNTEKIDTDSLFLSLFNAKVTEYIKPEYLHKVVFFRSTPGAGKSSIFRLFSPSVLREIVGNSNPNYEETRIFLQELSVITNNNINLLGVQLSCAGNYSIIDDLYDNGKRTQLFFALLNLRILRTTLKNLLVLNKMHQQDLSHITFVDIPPDIASCIDVKWNGEDIYNWAINEENRICRAMDDINDPGAIPFALNSLSFLSIIGANNLLIDNQSTTEHTLLMLDDLHLLTERQRNELREEVFKQKSTIGIWIAERISALTYDKILGTTGDEPRDYIELLVEKEINLREKQLFLNDIADRRVKINFNDTIGNYASCIEENFTDGFKLENTISKLKEYIFENGLNKELFTYFTENYHENYSGAIFLRALKILIDRRLGEAQLSFLPKKNIPIAYVISEDGKKTKVDDSALMSSAEFYLCIENKLPFYYGMKKLSALSSNNIEQFLEFAGAIFERRIAESFTSSKKRKGKISATEQEKIIKKIAQKKWDSITRQYTNYKDINNLLENICSICVENRDKALASYSGGSYTGIGINEDQFKELSVAESNIDVTRALANAVASNYLVVRDVSQGNQNEKWKVFYLNRWICALNNLPLQYGGWRPLAKNKYKVLTQKTPSIAFTTLEDYANA
ncbi:MAG: hypothetical protein LBU27_07015 [Candidatus Peribacteria bacterium]|jgi:hypothetical protein|nr:hypothetical protein [Candidatus Peribacteria bacterium]